MKPTFISRDDARELLRNHWLTNYDKEHLLEMCEPAWRGLRNYEFEQLLERDLGGRWCISEWCPFNGEYCRWRDHACDGDDKC